MGIKSGKEPWAELQRGLTISTLFSQQLVVFEDFGAGKWHVYSRDFPLQTIKSCGLEFFLTASSAFSEIKFSFLFFKERLTFQCKLQIYQTFFFLKKWNIPQWLEGLSNIFETPSLSCLVSLFTVIQTAEPKVLFLTVVHYFTLRSIGTPFTISCTPQ